MTQADFRAFSAAHNFKLGFLSALQGDIDIAVFEKYLTLPPIPNKALELEARLFAQQHRRIREKGR
jgi:hypothetical protein